MRYIRRRGKAIFWATIIRRCRWIKRCVRFKNQYVKYFLKRRKNARVKKKTGGLHLRAARIFVILLCLFYYALPIRFEQCFKVVYALFQYSARVGVANEKPLRERFYDDVL